MPRSKENSSVTARVGDFALGHLLLTKLVTILFLLQHKQQILVPVAFQALCDLLLARLCRLRHTLQLWGSVLGYAKQRRLVVEGTAVNFQQLA